MEPIRESDVIEISCVEVRTLTSRYLDGDLDLDTYVRVDAHLDHCRQCSAIYDGMRNVVGLLGSDKVFPSPAGLEERLHIRLVESGGCAW